MVKDIDPGEDFELKEKKTGKIRRITFNKACVDAVQRLLRSDEYHDNDFLFKSQRAPVLTVSTVNNMVKQWCRDIKFTE